MRASQTCRASGTNNLLPFLLILVLAFTRRAEAQSMVLSSNRWLIVVDTSASMDIRQQATMDSVGAMLLSGMNGQLRPGDTIGMWTFNEALSKGKFPLQLWHPAVTQQIAASAAQFLTAQKYQKSTRFDCVMPDIQRLVTNSDILTVILLTAGDATLKGTPYDDTINATFKKDFRTQKKAKAPFIVAFRSEGGRMTAFTLTPAPWLATFPPLPPAPVAQIETPAPPPTPAVAPTPEPPAPVVPSIIMTGKKNGSTNAAAETTSTPQGQPPITLQTGNIATLAPEPALIITQSIATVATETQAVETASSDTNVPPPENVTPQTTPQIPETPTAPTVQTPPTPETPAESVPVTTTTPKDDTTKAQIAKFEADHKDENKVLTAPEKTVAQNVVSTTVSQASAATPPSVAPAVAIAPASGTQVRLFLGIGLLIIAVAIGVFWIRKSRPPSSGSLITRSIDRDKRDS